MYLLEELGLDDEDAYASHKATTVEAKNEQEAVILDLLRGRKLEEAYQLLSLMTDSDRIFELAHEALQIAESLRDSEAIKQLINLQLNKRKKRDFFILALRALLRFSIDSAISFVLFTKLSDDDLDCGWEILERHYRKKNDLMKLEVIYDHLTDNHNKTRLAEYFLRSDEIVKNWESWIVWFGKYSNLRHASSAIYFRGKAIELLSAQSDIKVVTDVINRAFQENTKRDLLEHLYFHWIKSQEFTRCEQLEKHLPQELSWLVQVRELLRTGKNCEVLSKLSYTEQVWIVPLAVTQMIRNTDAKVDLIPVLLDTVALVPSCKEIIINTASESCIELSRFDDVICMLSHMDMYNVERTVLKMIETKKLNEIHQTKILRKVHFDINCSGQMWDKIKETFSPLLIENEQRRREEESYQKFRKDFLSHKNVGKKNKSKFREICLKLTTLIRHKLYAEALELCAVLASSDTRDGYVDSLIEGMVSVAPLNFDLCIKASRLYREKAVATSWSSFFEAVRRGNDRAIIMASIKCPFKMFAISFVSNAAVQILNEEDVSGPIEFLRSSGFLTSEWHTNQIKEKIVEGLFKLFEDDRPKLINRIKSWRKSGIAGFDHFVMSVFLQKSELENAVKLLNSFIANADEEKYEKEPCFIELKSYLGSAEPRRELFASINVLINKSARQVLLREICRVACRLNSDKALEIIRACPDKELKNEFCESILESCVVSPQNEVADKALPCLPSESQQYWRPVIAGIRQNQFRAVLNHWCTTRRFVTGLIDVVVKNCLKDVGAKDTLIEFSGYYRLHQDLVRNRPMVEDADLDDSMKRYKAKDDCNKVLNLISLHWCSVCLDSHKSTISEINEGLRIILPWYFNYGLYFDFFEKAKTKVFELAKCFNDIEGFLLLLIEHKKLEVKDLNTIERQWINAQIIVEIESLMVFVRNTMLKTSDMAFGSYEIRNWLDYARERLLKEYIDKKMFRDVLRLLPENMSYSERRLLMDCTERHLQALDLARVQCFIDKLMINLTEEDALRLVNYFLNANYLLEGKELFDRHVKTPTQVHALGERIIECYWKKLALLINPEGEITVKFIRDSYTKIAQIKLALKKGDNNEAIRLQTEIVQDMRRLPEIGLKEYCKRHFPNANFNFLYFPMVPTTEARDPALRLQELLSGSRLTELQREKPDMFDFLLSIQPAVNKRQIWLETLFPMSNIIKHDSNIKVDKVSVDFLTDLVNGVTLILLKFSNPLLLVPDLEKYRPSEFIELEELAHELTYQNIK